MPVTGILHCCTLFSSEAVALPLFPSPLLSLPFLIVLFIIRLPQSPSLRNREESEDPMVDRADDPNIASLTTSTSSTQSHNTPTFLVLPLIPSFCKVSTRYSPGKSIVGPRDAAPWPACSDELKLQLSPSHMPRHSSARTLNWTLPLSSFPSFTLVVNRSKLFSNQSSLSRLARRTTSPHGRRLADRPTNEPSHLPVDWQSSQSQFF